ncbi:MAG TPA: VOC family protein [Ktedonobacteraceae bacterium]|jgi:predicted enzyme related to lactoylglutathione lyase|nr:VOC family protein [Ktedonobacteraceae bacterium]
MEFFGIRLLVKDFPVAVRFWRDLIKVPLQFQDETMGYAYFDTGKAGLELMACDEFASAVGEATPVPEPQGRQIVLDFRVDDVDASYAELIAQGATSVSAPVDRPAWRARTAHIADPDGHVIELYSTLAANA